jgi:hypothetical protein
MFADSFLHKYFQRRVFNFPWYFLCGAVGVDVSWPSSTPPWLARGAGWCKDLFSAKTAQRIGNSWREYGSLNTKKIHMELSKGRSIRQIFLVASLQKYNLRCGQFRLKSELLLAKFQLGVVLVFLLSSLHLLNRKYLPCELFINLFKYIQT